MSWNKKYGEEYYVTGMERYFGDYLDEDLPIHEYEPPIREATRFNAHGMQRDRRQHAIDPIYENESIQLVHM